MNSLYRLYIKQTAVLLLAGTLLSLVYVYLCYTNLGAHISNIDLDTWYISNTMSQYTTACFFTNIILCTLLVYTFYKYRNKNTGIFIKHLPVKTGNDFIVKALLSVLFILLITCIQLFIFRLLRGTVDFMYNNLIEHYETKNTVIKGLEELYSEYHSDFISLSMAALLFTSVMFFFSNCIGVTGFSVAMPYIVYFSLISCSLGADFFKNEIGLNLDMSYIRQIAMNFSYTAVFDIPVFNADISEYLPVIISSLLFYAAAYFCCIHFDFSKVGTLFIFKWTKALTYFLGCIFGGFSLYLIGLSLEPDSVLGNVLILLVCMLISYIIIYKIEQAFE